MEQDRRTEFLLHLARYRVTTVDVVAGLFYADVKDPRGAAESTRTRLLKDGEIGSASLYGEGRDTYYFLTELGARAVGLQPAQAGPSNGDVFLLRFASLLFCCEPDAPSPKFTAEEFDQFFPGVRTATNAMTHAFYAHTYYLDVDDDDVRRLGRLIVDTGSSDPLNICRKKVLPHAEQHFAPFVAEHRFAISIVTGTHGQRDRSIRARVPQFSAENGTPVNVVAYSELNPLYLRPRRAEADEDSAA